MVISSSVNGVANQLHAIEATTNLSSPINWLVLTTNAASPNGSLIFTDRPGIYFPRRFYRAREFK